MKFICTTLNIGVALWDRAGYRLVTGFDEKFVCPLFHLNTYGNPSCGCITESNRLLSGLHSPTQQIIQNSICFLPQRRFFTSNRTLNVRLIKAPFLLKFYH